MLMVIPDPDQVTSTDPQDVPGLGTFPIPVSETGKSRAEWEKLIKQTGAPLVVRDVRSDEKLESLTTEKQEEEE